MGKAANSGLKLVIVGTGQTRGRRAHLHRLRESLVQELKTVADGQLYMIIELALRRLIDELKARPPGIEVIQVAELEPTQKDVEMVSQRARHRAAGKAAEKKGPTKATLAAAELEVKALRGRIAAQPAPAKKTSRAKKAP